MGYPVLVSEENGVITGYASFGDWRNFDGFRHTVEHSVYVHPAHQGKGLGRSAAKQTDRRSPRVRQACDGCRALSLRIRRRCICTSTLGFKTTAQMPQVGTKFGRWLDLTFMQLQLDDRTRTGCQQMNQTLTLCLSDCRRYWSGGAKYA